MRTKNFGKIVDKLQSAKIATEQEDKRKGFYTAHKWAKKAIYRDIVLTLKLDVESSIEKCRDLGISPLTLLPFHDESIERILIDQEKYVQGFFDGLKGFWRDFESYLIDMKR